MTITSTGAFEGTSSNPSCSRIAVKKDGASSLTWFWRPSQPIVPGVPSEREVIGTFESGLVHHRPSARRTRQER